MVPTAPRKAEDDTPPQRPRRSASVKQHQGSKVKIPGEDEWPKAYDDFVKWKVPELKKIARCLLPSLLGARCPFLLTAVPSFSHVRVCVAGIWVFLRLFL